VARSFLHAQKGGLQQFILKDGFDCPDLSDATAVTVEVGAVAVYSTSHDGGPVRWNTSETRRGEIIALVPMASFTTDHEDATITIDLEGEGDPIVWATKAIPVGTGSFMGSGGKYTEQCDVCHGWFPVEELVRQIQVRRIEGAANYLPWSRFNDAGWTVDTDDLGEVSMGRPRWYWKVHPYAGANIVNGAATFWGDGELVSKDIIDGSSSSFLLLQGTFGTHQTTVKPFLDVELGFYYDYGGGSEERYVIGSWSGVDGRQVWGSRDVSDGFWDNIDSVRAFFKVTTYDDQQLWWAESFRVQKNVSKPGMTNVPTAGSERILAPAEKYLGKTVVCREHWERLPKQINEYQPSFDGVKTVDDENQEL
jgi:hypothetical protein